VIRPAGGLADPDLDHVTHGRCFPSGAGIFYRLW
jgi:hypothetical protein